MRVASKTFEDLLVWQKAHQWVLNVYKFTEALPRAEQFGLTAQLRRAAISIPANIAEGFKKTGKADKARFYNIAQGSIEECRSHLILTKDLNYGNTDMLMADLEEIGRILEAYTKAVLGKQKVGANS